MKNAFSYILCAALIMLASCTKTETSDPTVMNKDSCQMQIDSLKAEIAELKKPHSRRIAHRTSTSGFTIDTTSLVQKTPHQIHEDLDEADEADHQTAADTSMKKVSVAVGTNGVTVQKTVDTTAPPPTKSIFEKIKGIFSKKK
jgi:hypothetical protein